LPGSLGEDYTKTTRIPDKKSRRFERKNGNITGNGGHVTWDGKRRKNTEKIENSSSNIHLDGDLVKSIEGKLGIWES